MIEVISGVERYIFDLDAHYKPYPMQGNFHGSPKQYRLLGGAAGPGKTLALINDHLVACSEFSDPVEAKQVHSLLLRRTHPRLEATLITRFREKVPKELYRSFNEQKKTVEWLNGATTTFGSMQYEHNAYDWQGQWYKIGFDEAAEFTFKQWMATSAWNRCPVSPYCTKDGATNPIGIGAGWLKNLFIDKRPCDEMDEHQRNQYNADKENYEYFPCTYLDNPVYANDPVFIANLQSYPAAIRDALMYGKWGVVGGYFQGAWDPAYNVYDPDTVEIKPWWIKWLGGDWGFEHFSAIYKFCLDDMGVVRTYGELHVNRQTPEELGESIVKFCGQDKFEAFHFSHDAFASKATSTMGANPNSVALRMTPILTANGLPAPQMSTRDKIGREQLMYELLKQRVKTGEVYNDDKGATEKVEVAKWQIADCCHKLIEKIPMAPRDEEKVEEIAEFLGDDPLQGAGYGLYGKFGKPREKPKQVQRAEAIEHIADNTAKHLADLKFEQDYTKAHKPFRRPLRFRR